MNDVVVCSCGKSLRVHEGIQEVVCPVCRQSTYLAGIEATSGNAAAVVFGFDPPQSSPPKVQLQYQVVEVSSETTTPTRRRKSREDDQDNDSRPYALERKDTARTDVKTQEEMWGPDIDLSADPHSPYPTLKKQRRGRRAGWALEKSWYECLAYPMRGWPLLAGLGFALAFATFGLLQVLRDDAPLGWLFYLIGAVALTYACGFFNCVLSAGAAGDALDVRWPGVNLKILLESLLAAVMSFLAGPIIPAAVGTYFWINSGDIAVIDQLILLELFVVTVGYWLLVFFSAALSDNWDSLLPAAVLGRVRQLGVARTFSALGFVLGIFLFHSWFAMVGLENHHLAASFILLLFCWTSLLFWMSFLMRWLGVCMFRSKKSRKAA